MAHSRDIFDSVRGPARMRGCRSTAGKSGESCKPPATFRELYRSRDGLITIYEDEAGHITSIDSSRLA